MRVFEPTHTPDAQGGFMDALAPLDPPTWHCAIDMAAVDRLQVTAGAIVPSGTVILRGRYRPDLLATCVLQEGAKSYTVQSSQDRTDRGAELTLVCVEEKWRA
jgi:head-tail adaptor